MTASLDALFARATRYATIFADPPWPERGGGRTKRGADRHYPLMTVTEIGAMGDAVKHLANPRSHLYLWTTNNFLPHALDVMTAWGFRYVTTLTWRKPGNVGLGQYYRGVTEHVLFGVSIRGTPPYRYLRDGRRAQGQTGFAEPRGRHSEKPAIVYDWARQVSPPPYLELFGIGERPGWTVWGNGLWTK